MTQSLTDLNTFVRQGMIAVLDDLSVEQINEVPQGFNNNLIWNLAHVVACQQEYLYDRAGVETAVNVDFIAKYRGGTAPAEKLDQNAINTIKELALSTAQALVKDAKGNLRNAYKPMEVTGQKINLQTLDDAIAFMLFHEGLHLSTMRTYKRLLTANDQTQQKAA